MLSEKLKVLRRQTKMSQEQLAEKLNVSRQAVTKWETGAGVPDLDNLCALSALFQISLDELLENEGTATSKQDFLFDSVTEYDIDCEKSFDVNLAGARQVVLEGYEGEKVQVRLASDQIPEIRSLCKVKIDDVKQRIDIDVHRTEPVTETKAKEAIYVFLRFPQKYTKRIELAGNTERLDIRNLTAENIEFSGKASFVILQGNSGHLELNCNEDLEICWESWNGRLDLNQISATSKLCVPAGLLFATKKRGIANHILFEKDGKSTEDFSVQGDEARECENIIELNGMKSELVIFSKPAELSLSGA